jgi:hypothetical protein
MLKRAHSLPCTQWCDPCPHAPLVPRKYALARRVCEGQRPPQVPEFQKLSHQHGGGPIQAGADELRGAGEGVGGSWAGIQAVGQLCWVQASLPASAAAAGAGSAGLLLPACLPVQRKLAAVRQLTNQPCQRSPTHSPAQCCGCACASAAQPRAQTPPPAAAPPAGAAPAEDAQSKGRAGAGQEQPQEQRW